MSGPASETKAEIIKASRESWMDIFKGFAIIFVVLVHVFRGMTLAQISGKYQTAFLYIDYTVCTFLMPMFFLISGVLYTKEKKLTAVYEYKTLFVKKLIQLGIPYFIFSCLQGVLRLTFNGQTNVPFTLDTLLLIPFAPFDHFWFLYALLLIFWIVPLMELVVKNDHLVLLLLLSLNILSTVLNHHWPIGLFCAYGFYFYLGTILYRHYWACLNHLPFLIGMSLLYLTLNLYCHNLQEASMSQVPVICLYILMAIVGSLMSVLLSRFILNNIFKKLWLLLGQYSFEIYLLHSLATSSARMLLIRGFHIASPEIHVAVGLALGLAIPLVIALAAKKVSILNFAFFPAQYLDYGKQPKTRTAPTPEPA